MTRRRVVVLVAAVVGAIVYPAYRWRRGHAPFEWSGTVEARTIELGSRFGGRVQRVLAREGEAVEAGQTLIVLEAAELPGQRLQAEGDLEQARAALEKVTGTVPSARRSEINAARARLRSERANLEQARIDDQRTRQLFSSGSETEVARDAAALGLERARGEVAALEAQLEELLRGTPEDMRMAQGKVEAAEGKLREIDAKLDELIIRAPAAASIESLDLRPGDLLAPNAAAVQLLEPDQLYVRIYVPETQLGHVRLGAAVPVYVDTFPKRPFAGVVENIAQEGEFSPRNLQTADERANQVFAVRVRLDEGRDVLRAGMAAIVRVSR